MTQRNALTVLGAKHAQAGKYNDGHGLWLHKRRRDHGRWFVRLVVFGKRREMGLGTWPDVSIAEARERAATARRRLRDGVDPVAERQAQRHREKHRTVEEVVMSCFEAKQAELKGNGIPGQWLSPLTTHVLPVIGEVPIEDVDQHLLKRVFEPIWHEKPESAKKGINRLNLALKHAVALGLEVDLQAVMKTKALLGQQRREKTHIPSLPYEALPEFYAWLARQGTTASMALRFLILTGARTSEVLHMSFAELNGDVWEIPAGRTKVGRAHRIPLSYQAMTLIEPLRGDESGFVFRGRGDKPLSNMAMLNIMKRQEMDARPHGFRATFRTWMEEMTETPFEVKELALAHTVGSDTVRAYQRSDHLEKRRGLMLEWGRFCSSGLSSSLHTSN